MRSEFPDYRELFRESDVTNGAIVIHTQRLKSDPGGNLLS
ncbi:nonribosomal peptide synthetase/polyketide synthase [Escherichia coli]|nr:nonribosomal peptide synthetase/polyketide synthase [Escherichia coli]EEW1899134.1 nonribosomal peptide synthetase/polyketide synthase [Escherichia coli]EEZ0137026.1 nonribosomal peptide synthetase/polyketide synthase [Escherichia coli]EFA4449053.1 nonribosomal peptide synthetase/polyketide synthase [Escherichia coli]EFA5090269.1 nonribosomal peptide synthetase/polyketide synthase [Escherichia coli]